MNKLLIEGEREGLKTVKNVVKALGDFKVVEIVGEEADSLRQVHESKPGTCSACPYFTEVYGSARSHNVLWGKCSKYGDASINMYSKICRSYEEEVKVEVVSA